MGSVEVMLSKLCPNGVDYKLLGEVTTWDKKFNGTDKALQPKTVKFKHVSASKLKQIAHEYGDIRLLATGVFEGYAHIDEVDESIINVGEVISIPSGGAADIKYHDGKFIDSGNLLAVSSDSTKYSLKYIWYWLLANNHHIQDRFRGSAVQHPDMPSILKLEVPIPPLPVQEEIVRILDTFTELTAELTAELAARKKQYEFYREKLVSLESGPTKVDKADIQLLTLGEVGPVQMCKRILKADTAVKGDVPFYKIGTFGKEPDAYITQSLYDKYRKEYSFPNKGDVLISASGTIGRTVIYDGKPAYFQDSNIVWVANDESKVLNKYLYHFYALNPWKVTAGGTIPRLYTSDISRTKMPVPPLSVQQEIVAILDQFDTLTNSLTEGIPHEIALRQKQYEFYREKLLTF